MDKFLNVRFHLTGEEYEIPVVVVAKLIVDNLVDLASSEYMEKMQSLMEDEFEIFENIELLSWEDLAPYAIKKDIDLAKEWKEGNRTCGVNEHE